MMMAMWSRHHRHRHRSSGETATAAAATSSRKKAALATTPDEVGDYGDVWDWVRGEDVRAVRGMVRDMVRGEWAVCSSFALRWS